MACSAMGVTLFTVFKQHLLLVVEIPIREIHHDLVVGPAARRSQLQILEVEGTDILKIIWKTSDQL